MNNPRSFSNLDWSLQFNSELGQLLYSTYFNTGYLKYLDELIATLRSKAVRGIREKLADVSDLFKFLSTVSELEIARVLCSKYATELLPDDAWSGSSPDIVVRDGEDMLIEVKRLTEDEAVGIIRIELRQFLPYQKPPIRVDVRLKEVLSLPVVKRPERTKKEEIAKRSINQFKEHFEQASKNSLPIKIETEGAIFSLHSTYRVQQSYPGVISTEAITVPEELLMEKLIQDVCEKAGKRNSFPREKRSCPYIVAIDSEQKSIDDITLQRAFIGDTVYVMPPLPVPKEKVTTEVAYAIAGGWESFLKQTAIVPSNRSYLPYEKRGAFFTRPELRNVSLVIVRTAISRDYLPNPFSHREINRPSLLTFL